MGSRSERRRPEGAMIKQPDCRVDVKLGQIGKVGLRAGPPDRPANVVEISWHRAQVYSTKR